MTGKSCQIKAGKITKAEKVPRTDKLYKLLVDIGDKEIQIVTSLVHYYSEEELKDQKIIVLANLKPTKFAGELSQGMLLCAEKDVKFNKILNFTDRGFLNF